jgi:TPR repeat protein
MFRHPASMVSAAALLALAGSVLSCGAGSGAKAIRDEPGKVGEALGASECIKAGEDAEPWVVDLPAERGGEIEGALGKGQVVLVSWDCKELRLVRGCTVTGTYEYSGWEPRPERKVLEDADSVGASLSGGQAIKAKIAAEMERGTKLLIGYSFAGQYATTLPRITRNMLSGDSGVCAKATHFVSTATVGAYAVTSSAGAEIGAVAEIFDQGARGQSSSKEFRATKVGELEACNKAKAGDNPTPQCLSPVKMLLVGIAEGAPPSGGLRPRPSSGNQVPCPPGSHRSDGMCLSSKKAKTRVCEIGDEADCNKQCAAGDAPSCANLGFMYEKGKGITANDKKAFEFYKKACDQKDLDGCTGLGVLYSKGQGVDANQKLAATIFQEACNRGNARACSSIGHQARLKRDYDEAVRWFERACKGGYERACFYAASFMVKLKKDERKAFSYANSACVGDDFRGCLVAASMMYSGAGTSPNPAEANKYQSKALNSLLKDCEDKDSEACEVIGDFYNGQYGKKGRAPEKALPFYEKGCSGGQWDACYEAGLLQEKGDPPVKANPATAKQLFDKACQHGVTAACSKIGKRPR